MGLIVALLCGGFTTWLTPWILRRIAEPAADVPGADAKIPYAALATARFAIACGALSAAATLVAWLRVPRELLPLWTVLAILGVILVAIDAVTTWIPRRVCHWTWLAMILVAAPLAAVMGADWVTLGRTAIGAVVFGLSFLLFALPKNGIGFGDVRLAPVLGAAVGALSWTAVWWALLLAALVGGCFGVILLLRRHRGPLPYAPSMLLGTYLALLVH